MPSFLSFFAARDIVLSLIIIAFGKDMLGIGKGDSTHLIVVKDGATTEDIAYLLKDEGIIRSPKAFIYFSKLRKSDAAYIPGEHFIKENMAYETIIQKLTTTESEAKEAVELTFKEYELLRYLLINLNIVLTRESIMQNVWGTDFEGESRTLDMHIRSLRRKLGESGRYIRTVRNVGYVLDGTERE